MFHVVRSTKSKCQKGKVREIEICIMVIGWGLHVRPWLLVEMKDATAVATEITSTASVPWSPEPLEPQPIPFCMNFQEAGWHFSRFVLSAVEIAHVLVEQAWKCQRPFNCITLTVELTCLKASLFKSVWLITDNTSRRACCHPLCACVRETAAICSLITVDEPIACVMKNPLPTRCLSATQCW